MEIFGPVRETYKEAGSVFHKRRLQRIGGTVTDCPICSRPYQPGEQVLIGARRHLAAWASEMPIAHARCVVGAPVGRLLELLLLLRRWIQPTRQ